DRHAYTRSALVRTFCPRLPRGCSNPPTMSFAWSQLLWLLVVPVAALWWEFTHQRRVAAAARPKILRAEAGPRSLVLAQGLSATSPASRPRVWLYAGLALSIVALARPQWGRIEEPVFDQSREILLAIDL